jgi:tetratricopeptide (TPR) repeat protein
MNKKESAVIRKKYEQAIKAFTRKKFTESAEALNEIIDEHKNDKYDLAHQIISEAKIKLAIIESKLNPLKIELEGPEDMLSEGLFCLNSGNYETALDLFGKLLQQDFQKPYTLYLMSIASYKNENTDSTLKYLKDAIELDDYYKILAYNESDFGPLTENEEFIKLVEINTPGL